MGDCFTRSQKVASLSALHAAGADWDDRGTAANFELNLVSGLLRKGYVAGLAKRMATGGGIAISRRDCICTEWLAALGPQSQADRRRYP